MTHRILIVDDEANHRRALSISLRMEGYEVLQAADGQQALEVLRREEVDVVIADLMMPRVDGLELARRLRFSNPATKMILMSAYHLSRAQLDRAQVGDIRFLPKPYEFETLASLLADCFDASGTHARVDAASDSDLAAAL
jgi:DNA-binding NtrC family response regulator